MGKKVKEVNMDDLQQLANEYCDYCISSTKEVATGSGKIVEVKERHLPTTAYFLLHWLRRNHFDFYKRTNWYHAMNKSDHPYSNTIKSIDEQFNALARDIVANEGKGIFYAKNKLGMTDKIQETGEKDLTIKVKYEGSRSNLE